MRKCFMMPVAGLILLVAIATATFLEFSANEMTASLEPSPKELMENGKILTTQTAGATVVLYDHRVFICEFGGKLRDQSAAFGPCFESEFLEEYK